MIAPNYVTSWRAFLATDSLPETPPMQHYNPDERHDTGPTDEELDGEISIHEQIEYAYAQRRLEKLTASGAPMSVLEAAARDVTATREALARVTQ